MFTWELFMVCGDPADESTYYAGFAKDQVSSISRPDNITFDNAGNLWIATDGQPSSLEFNDGIFAVPTEGVDRGNLKLFFTGVPGGEVSGPIFTPDNTALFASIQHPGEGGTYEDPLTSWPGESGPPRPSVVLITRIDGGLVGS
jgi:secreted PhoX family phosphatase